MKKLWFFQLSMQKSIIYPEKHELWKKKHGNGFDQSRNFGAHQ